MKRAINLQIFTRCVKCDVQLPVNGLVAEVPCWGCNNVLLIGAAGWQRLLAEPLAEARRQALDQDLAMPEPVLIDHHDVNVEYDLQEPFCPDCTEPIAVEGALAQGRTICVCGAADCHARVSIIVPAPELRAFLPPWVTHLLDTPPDPLAPPTPPGDDENAVGTLSRPLSVQLLYDLD